MSTITVSGKSIEVDEEGFLVSRSDWSEDVTREMAKADVLDLTPDHCEIINLICEYYEQYQIPPNARLLAKTIAKKHGPDKGNLRYLYKLFPYGPVKQANRFAGLMKLCKDP